ncbi:MAG: protein-methionine-sulfoxide reductase catalytic subunit MsrP [Alphaproteobacteria bacterium]|nr:protein-methionine-sulfoxide reductase catalytic subunit MsrP [Alphaproteobacteria bacterium]
MLIKIPRGWERPVEHATPEAVFRNRRALMKSLAAGPILASSSLLLAACDDAPKVAAQPPEPDPSAPLYPVDRNATYTLDRPITSEKLATSYNNYYEFGSSKSVVAESQAIPLRPWMVAIDGLVDKPIEIGVDDLLKQMPLEERLYRHRCVEAWSMDVPWSGFALKALVDFAQPKSDAKYLEMTSFNNPEVAPGQKSSWYPWPYVEGVTLAEAANEMAFIATGAYGKPLPKQNGAPLRLTLPWKYGFKSSKGLVRFTFTDKRPVGFWERIQGREYGFWANVNPEVSHPRWSQATERVLGIDGRVPTRLYNGYGEFVAELYKDMKNERLFM